MRPRTQIENEARALSIGRIANIGIRSIDPLLTRKDLIFLEVLLDIRDGLYEDASQPTKGITT